MESDRFEQLRRELLKLQNENQQQLEIIHTLREALQETLIDVLADGQYRSSTKFERALRVLDLPAFPDDRTAP